MQETVNGPEAFAEIPFRIPTPIGWPFQAASKTDHRSIPSPEDLRTIVFRVQLHDESAKHELYQMLNRGIRFQLVRHLGTSDIEDKVHDAFLVILQAILRNEIHSPERLLGYVRTVVRRQIANHIERTAARRKEVAADAEVDNCAQGKTPEENYVRNEERLLMMKALRELKPRDRKILIRFYLDEMSQEQICEEMGLSMTQFRLLKSRAKAKFSELGKRQLRPSLATRWRAVAG
jgi:RNA polymerase sigma-70 factor (ECF subfamily)